MVIKLYVTPYHVDIYIKHVIGIRIINYLDINVHVYTYYYILCDYDKFIRTSLDISDNIKFSLPWYTI